MFRLPPRDRVSERDTFGGNIIETGTDSYRLAQTRAARQP
jgi:hypothetical protein